MTKIDRMFSDYRSEWIVDDFDERFVEPPYYGRFLDMRPTFLIGGRGTGKTITLRSLHFSNKDREGRPRHLGIYVKAFKNRILAFSGRHVDQEVWLSAFEHYMNLLCSIELAELCVDVVFRPQVQVSIAQRNSIARICEYLSISGQPTTYQDLYESLRMELARLTSYVIAPRIEKIPRFSFREEPLVEFAKDVHSMAGFGEKPIYICIDEWENLSEAQQQVMNAWIKNSGRPISYKLGVREKGIKTHRTGDSKDPLMSPSDYSEEHISGDEIFCRQVAERRLSLARNRNMDVPDKLSAFLERVRPREEAEILGAQRLVKQEVSAQKRAGHSDLARWLQTAPLDQAYLAIHLRDRGVKKDLQQIVSIAMNSDKRWQNWLNNYRYASLFTITRGHLGVSMRKLYAGDKILLKLSGGNVRYLLELLDEAVRVYSREHADDEHEGTLVIDCRSQTVGATTVAKRHVDQIQGLSNEGFRIARLVRSLGTVFSALIRNPSGSAPEVTGFVVKGQHEDIEKADRLLREGSAILAFLAERPTKLTSPKETQQDEYRLHPILAPYFNISHRRKRRIRVDAKELLQAATDFEGANSLHVTITGHPMGDAQRDLLST